MTNDSQLARSDEAGLARLGLDRSGPLAASYTRMEAGEATTVAGERWGISGSARRLEAEKDDTFLIETAPQQGVVLKVAAPVERRLDLEFETALMRHVNDSGAGVTVPTTLPARDGQLIVPLIDLAGQPRLARAITLIPGCPLDVTPSGPKEREHVGETLAGLRHATSDFSHPGDGRLCPWNVAHLLELAPLLDYVHDVHQRELLEQGMAEYAREVQPRLHLLRAQVLHNDFSKSNIIVDPCVRGFVTGIIDFGDAVRTAIAIDVSTALLNQLPRTWEELIGDDLFAQGRDLMRGYLRHAELTRTELALLPQLVRGRVLTRAMITLYRAELLPENRAYILRNTEQGWMQLRWLNGRSADELSNLFL